MIKVVVKTFALLEFVAARAGRPVLPSEAALALKLNQATTVRILRDLLELGYLTQISRTKGYVLGPMAHSVFPRNVYRDKLMRIAAPVVAQCADQTGESVVLAVMQGARRYVLLSENRNPAMNVDLSALYYDDLYLTATGRVLLAYADAADVAMSVKRMGMPDKRIWPAAGTMTGLRAELDAIRRTGHTAFHSALTGLFIMAAPVFENEACTAALGLSFPHDDYSRSKHMKMLTLVVNAAAEVSKKLAVLATVG